MASEQELINKKAKEKYGITGGAQITKADERWLSIVRRLAMDTNPDLTDAQWDKIKTKIKSTYMYKASRGQGTFGEKEFMMVGNVKIPASSIESGYSDFLNDYYYPLAKEAEIKDLTGDLKGTYFDYNKQQEEIANVRGDVGGDITPPPQKDPIAPVEPPPPTTPDYSILDEQLKNIGGTAENLRDYRTELLKRPELEGMSPEFRTYLSTTLESIEASNRESVRRVEESAAKGGFSPYSQRAVSEKLEAGGREKRRTEAELRLQDLNKRMEDLRQKEVTRRNFLTGEYQNLQQVGLNIAQMKQRRKDETEDDYKNRMRYLTDELRNRGWKEQDITNAMAFQREGEAIGREQYVSDVYRSRGWNVQDINKQRKQQLEDYEKQKRDWYEMLAASKPKEQPWWQKGLNIAGQAVGYAATGGIYNAVSGGIKSLTTGGGGGGSNYAAPSFDQSSNYQNYPINQQSLPQQPLPWQKQLT